MTLKRVTWQNRQEVDNIDSLAFWDHFLSDCHDILRHRYFDMTNQYYLISVSFSFGRVFDIGNLDGHRLAFLSTVQSARFVAHGFIQNIH